MVPKATAKGKGHLRGLGHTVDQEGTMIGDAAQYQELVALYSSYSDGELIALGRDMADLTEMAQEALKGELTRRGLKLTPASKSVEARAITDEDLVDMRTYAELAPDECIFDFPTEQAASAAYYALTREGVNAIVVSPKNAKKFDNRGPRVVVTPKDAERAASIFSQLATGKLTEETLEVADAEFEVPRCPACGSEETLLESVDPVNQWRCEDCGHTWLEESVSATP
jgi:ribosomal protein L37AE/L43A